MTSILQKLPTTYESAFFAKTLNSTQFHAPWHHHNELEIILISAGSGSCFVGNYTGKYSPGNVFLIGANVPHIFSSDSLTEASSGVQVQFKADFWGTDFTLLPEFSDIRNLFEQSKSGIKISAHCEQPLAERIKELEVQRGFDRIITLCSCLNMIAADNGYQLLSTTNIHTLVGQKRDRLEKVFKFTSEEFARVITLKEVADIAGMSIPAFCDYFRKTVKKTYIEFLNEVRLSFACNLLIESDMTVSEIFFQSGYNTPANFNRQFLKYKGISPSIFRKSFHKNYLSTKWA